MGPIDEDDETTRDIREAIEQGARILVVVAKEDDRTPEFFALMYELCADMGAMQITLTPDSTEENSIYEMLEAAHSTMPEGYAIILNAEHLSPADKGQLASRKAADTLPITILVTSKEPDTLADQMGRPGPWSLSFATNAVDNAFQWEPSATMTLHNYVQTTTYHSTA